MKLDVDLKDAFQIGYIEGQRKILIELKDVKEKDFGFFRSYLRLKLRGLDVNMDLQKIFSSIQDARDAAVRESEEVRDDAKTVK